MVHQDRRDVGNQARGSATGGVCRALRIPSRTNLFALLLLGLGCSTLGNAAEPDVASLQREVTALSTLVQRLQARVDRLELQASAAAPSASAPLRIAPAITTREPVRAAAGAVSRDEIPATPIAARRIAADSVEPSPLIQLQGHWAKISTGMTSAEVFGLLGEPTRRLNMDGRTVWYYSYPALGNGSVFFTDAGIVSSRQSPFPWGG
jgi:outer membrane murein-binding lipoprotein Lpp